MTNGPRWIAMYLTGGVGKDEKIFQALRKKGVGIITTFPFLLKANLANYLGDEW